MRSNAKVGTRFRVRVVNRFKVRIKPKAGLELGIGLVRDRVRDRIPKFKPSPDS